MSGNRPASDTTTTQPAPPGAGAPPTAGHCPDCGGSMTGAVERCEFCAWWLRRSARDGLAVLDPATVVEQERRVGKPPTGLPPSARHGRPAE